MDSGPEEAKVAPVPPEAVPASDTRFTSLLVHVDASIGDAMSAIDSGSYEIALVVDSHSRLIGTVTDGDVRRALLAGHALGDTVFPHMSKEPRVVDTTAGRVETLDLMRAHAISQIPVVDDDGRVVGLHVMRELLGVVDRPNWAVIMAGGRGSRLAPFTDVIPKPMVRVAGRPILERLVLHLVGAGVRRIVISVNYLAPVIQQHFGSGEEFGCRIDYLVEEPSEPLGTGGSLALLGELGRLPEEPFLVLNGDLVTQFAVGDLLEHHARSGAVATMAVRDHSHEVPYGVVTANPEGSLVDVVEKPVVTWSVNAGIYVLEPRLLSRIPRAAYQLPDLFRTCLDRDEKVAVWPVDDEWLDVGSHSELRRALGES